MAYNKSITPKSSDYSAWMSCLELAQAKNGWFTQEQVLFALESWSKELTKDSLEKWMYSYANLEQTTPKDVLLVMAGNIPLVGFHDFLAVLLCRHRAIVKLSSSDSILLPFLFDQLVKIAPWWKDQVIFTQDQRPEFDAVIATGSNNTARYFEYYFNNKPNIIRKNRNSVAVLSGKESKENLKALGKDIFTYFGLGCRSVSKLYVPEGYSFDAFYQAIFEPYQNVLKMEKYTNNYDYNKAVYLMSEFDFLDNGFLMVKEEKQFGSPIATLFFEYYQSTTPLS
ncbi:MAG: acyl-CoA reductase, partial [Flavobacteriaceae bacterium]|nr:acyl-CoA reductase [Flavobacteriaceae bacterium]